MTPGMKKLFFNVLILCYALSIKAQDIFNGIAYDSIYHYELDSTKKNLLPTFKAVDFVYSPSLKPLSLTGKVYKNGSWSNYSKKTFSYDTSDNLTIDLSQGSYINDWFNTSQTLYTYTPFHKIETAVYQTWNFSTNDWKNETKTTYSYNTNGKETSKQLFDWESNTWFSSYRYTTIYNPDETIEKKIYDLYNEITSSWEIREEQSFTYDANKNVTTCIIQNNGINTNKTIYSYNNKNQLIQTDYFQWNASVWVQRDRKYTTWGANDSIVYEKIESNLNGNYLLTATTTKTYNTANQLIELFSTIYDIYKGDGTTVKSKVKIHYYINENLMGTDQTELPDNQITIYPNPCHGTFTIDVGNKYALKNIEVYNMLGAYILHEKNLNQIIIPNANPGIYFVKIGDDTGVYTKKIIVQ